MQIAKMPDGTLIVTMSPDEGAIMAATLDNGCHYRSEREEFDTITTSRARTIASQLHDAACFMRPVEDPLNVAPNGSRWEDMPDDLLANYIEWGEGPCRELHREGRRREILRRNHAGECI